MPKPSLMDTPHYAHILIAVAKGIERPGEIREFVYDQAGIEIGIYDKLAKLESYGLVVQGERIFGKSKGHKKGGSIGHYSINSENIAIFIQENFLGTWDTPNSMILEIESTKKIKDKIVNPILKKLEMERIERQHQNKQYVILEDNLAIVESILKEIYSRLKDNYTRRFLSSNKRRLSIFLHGVFTEACAYKKTIKDCYSKHSRIVLKKKHRKFEPSNNDIVVGKAFIRYLAVLSAKNSGYSSIITIRKIIEEFICSLVELSIWGMPNLPNKRYKVKIKDEILSFGRYAFNYWYSKERNQLKMELIDSLIPTGKVPKRVTKAKSNIHKVI